MDPLPTTTTPTPPAPPTPSPQPTLPNRAPTGARPATTIIIGLLVLIILGLSAYIAYDKLVASKTLPPIPSPSPLASPQPSAQAGDPTANWLTYTSSTYSVKYPSNLQLVKEENNAISLVKWGPTQGEGTEFFDGIALRFEAKSSSKLTPLQYAQNHVDELTQDDIWTVISAPTQTTVANYPASTYILSGAGGGPSQYIIVQSQTNQLVEIINNTNDPSNLGFANTISQILSTFRFTETPKDKTCIVGGCSGQLCVDANAEPVATTCEWIEEYTCYQTATCELQQDGNCGWTKTPELTTCLNKYK